MDSAVLAALIGVGGVLVGIVLQQFWSRPAERAEQRRYELVKAAIEKGYQPAITAIEYMYDVTRVGAQPDAAEQELRRVLAAGGHLVTDRREADLRLAARGELDGAELLDVLLLLRRERDHLAAELLRLGGT